MVAIVGPHRTMAAKFAIYGLGEGTCPQCLTIMSPIYTHIHIIDDATFMI